LWDGQNGEEQAHECIAEDGGNFVDCLIEHGVVITHGGVLSETTHDDLRYAVELASGGWDLLGDVAAFVNYIYGMRAICPAWTAASAMTAARDG
jgi:hypothetical protein